MPMPCAFMILFATVADAPGATNFRLAPVSR